MKALVTVSGSDAATRAAPRPLCCQRSSRTNECIHYIHHSRLPHGTVLPLCNYPFACMLVSATLASTVPFVPCRLNTVFRPDLLHGRAASGRTRYRWKEIRGNRTHLWYWACRKLNSSLIRSHESETVNLKGWPDWWGPCSKQQTSQSQTDNGIKSLHLRSRRTF